MKDSFLLYIQVNLDFSIYKLIRKKDTHHSIKLGKTYNQTMYWQRNSDSSKAYYMLDLTQENLTHIQTLLRTHFYLPDLQIF